MKKETRRVMDTKKIRWAAAVVLVGAAVAASLMPAARAARVDVLQALRTE